MSEFLTVRLSSQKEATIPWLVWSSVQQEIIASGEVQGWEQLEQLRSYAEQRITLLLIASSDVVLNQVEIPAGANRQLESMIPYLIEDDVAQDVDDMHFCVLKKSGHVADVAGIDRQLLKSLLDKFASIGIDVKQVIPDVLAVPQREGLTALQIGNDWLIRKGEYHGICIESDWLALFSRCEWVKEEGGYLPLIAYTPLPKLSLDDDQQWEFIPSPLVMQLLTQQALQSRINLLTGRFRTKSAWFKYWQIWKKTAMAAAVLVAVLIGHNLLEIYRLEQQAQAYRAESERIVRTIRPDRQKIPTVSYLKRLINDELNALQAGTNRGSVLEWFSQLPSALDSVQLQSIKFDSNRGEVRIEATSKDFQSFEQARMKLEQQFKVQQGPVNRNGDVVAGSFILQRK